MYVCICARVPVFIPISKSWSYDKCALCSPSNYFPAPFSCSHRFLSGCCEVLIRVRLQRCFPWHKHGSDSAHPLLWQIRLWEASGSFFPPYSDGQWREKVMKQKFLLLTKSFPAALLEMYVCPKLGVYFKMLPWQGVRPFHYLVYVKFCILFILNLWYSTNCFCKSYLYFSFCILAKLKKLDLSIWKKTNLPFRKWHYVFVMCLRNHI